MFRAGHHNSINVTTTDEQCYLLYYIVPINKKYKILYKKKN